MCVRQRTKWVSCKVRDLDGSSAPFVLALESSVTNRIPKNISFCKKHYVILFTRYRTFLYLFHKYLYLSPYPCMGRVIKSKIKKLWTSNPSNKCTEVEWEFVSINIEWKLRISCFIFILSLMHFHKIGNLHNCRHDFSSQERTLWNICYFTLP